MPIDKFTKMHGCGNSFLVAMSSAAQAQELLPYITRLCQPSFGIGCDGVMLIEMRKGGEFEVFMYNPDSSLMGMCGNGIRCVARFVYEQGLIGDTSKWVSFVVEGRTIECRIDREGQQVQVNMGAPRFEPDEIPLLRDKACLEQPLDTPAGQFIFTAVSMGNPHCVIFVDDPDQVDLEKSGPMIENLADFPRRTNVEFVSVLSRQHLKVRVWERGAGITLACGTGACAALVAGVLAKRCDATAQVELPGGSVTVAWDRECDSVLMTGEACRIGEIQMTHEFYSGRNGLGQRGGC